MQLALPLDHLSLRTPSLDATLACLLEKLGLQAVRTPQAPREHSRIHLDRCYMEVAQPVSQPPSFAGIGVSSPCFFLRFDHPDLEGELRRLGLRPRPLTAYQGKDGVWEDLSFEEPEAEGLLLVRRTQPPEVAKDWPPALRASNPAGILALSSVLVATPRFSEAQAFFRKLCGSNQVGPPRDDGFLQATRCDVQLPAGRGRITLLERERQAVEGVGLAVQDLGVAQRFVESRGVTTTAAGAASPGSELWLELGLPGSFRWSLQAVTP
jgi:hypothetical protein